VYGAQDAVLDEESETNPLSEYASSKLTAEETLNDTDSIIFRLGTLFGVSDRFARIRLDLVVNVLVTKALLEKKMSVFGGEQWRPLLHVNDVASAIDKTLDSNMKGIYNLHYENYKIIDIAEEIAKKVPDSVIETTPMPFQDSRNYRVSSDKLINESNFKPSFDLSVGIDEIYNLIIEKRIKDVNDPRYSNQSFLQRYGVS
tara:strand:- start:248 stop:850 length:603 start_codon:yes stop_codon:yes gene_type:complete